MKNSVEYEFLMTGNLAKGLDDASDRGRSLENTLRRITVALGATWSVDKAIQFERKVIDIRSELKSLETSFEVLGGQAAGKDLFEWVRQFAARTPLMLNDLAKGAQTLLAFNTNIKEVPQILQEIGDISMGDSQKFNSLALALGQMTAAGRLMGQDLLQMINAGFNPLVVISEKTGKSMKELKDEMANGEITVEMVKDAYKAATSEGGKFNGMLERQGKELKGALAQMEGAWQNMFNRIGSQQEGMLLSGVRTLTALIDNYEQVGRVILEVAAAYGLYRAALMACVQIDAARKLWSTIQFANQMRRELGLLTTAQTIFNGTALMNPYVWVAAAAASLAFLVPALYRNIKGNTAMADTAEAARVAEEALNKKTEEKKQLLDEATAAINDENRSEGEKQDILRQLKAAFPKVFSQYRTWIDLQKNLEKATAAANDELQRQRSLQGVTAVTGSQNELAELRRLRTLYRQLNYGHGGREPKLWDEYQRLYKKYYPQISKSRGTFESEASAIDNYIAATAKQVNEGYEKLRGQQNSAYDLYLQKQSAEHAKKTAAHYDQLIAQARKEGKRYVKVAGETAPVDLNELKRRRDAANSRALEVEQQSHTDYLKKRRQEYEAAEKKYQATLKDHSATDEALEAAKKARDDAKKKYEERLGHRLKTSPDIPKAGERLAAEAAGKIREYQASVSKEVRRANLEIAQADVDSMEDGFEKTKRQIALTYERMTLENTERREAMARALTENQRTDWERRHPDWKKKGLTPPALPQGEAELARVQLAPEQERVIAEYERIAMEHRVQANRELNEKMISQYADYTEQRLQIERKYDADIAAMERQRADSTDQAEKDRLTAAIAHAAKEKYRQTAQLDFQSLTENPEYVKAFENLGQASTETLERLIREFERVKESAAQNLKPQDLKQYADAIEQMRNEVDARNPFQSLSDAMREYATAMQELKQAERQYAAVTAGTDRTQNEEGALERLSKAKERTAKASDRMRKSGQQVEEIMGKVADGIRNVGTAIGGEAGEILQFISDIVSFGQTALKAMETAATATSEALRAVQNSVAILAIIAAAIQLLQELNALIGDAHDQYEKFAEDRKNVNLVTEAVDAYRMAVTAAHQAENEWFAEDNLSGLRSSFEYSSTALEAYMDKLHELQATYVNESGKGWLTGTVSKLGTLMNKVTGKIGPAGWLIDPMSMGAHVVAGKITGEKDYDQGLTEAMNNLRIETRKRSKGFLGSGIGGHSQKTEDLQAWINAHKDQFGLLDTDLFDEDDMLNKELAQAVLDKFGDKLVGQTKETLEYLIDMREEYDKYMEQLKEYVSDMYEPVVENMTDALWDWLDEGKDALDAFKGYASDTFRDIVTDMLRTIVLEKVVGSFKDDIARVYQDFSEGKISQEELMQQVATLSEDLARRYNTQLPVLQETLKTMEQQLKDASGIDIRQNEDEQEARQSGKAGITRTITEETGSEIKGLLTSGQLHWASMDNKMDMGLERLGKGLDVLDKIEENTRYCRKLDAIAEDIQTIRRDGVRTR